MIAMTEAERIVEKLNSLPRSVALNQEVAKLGLTGTVLADYGDGSVIGYTTSDGSKFVYWLDPHGKSDGVTTDDRDIPEEFYPFYFKEEHKEFLTA